MEIPTNGNGNPTNKKRRMGLEQKRKTKMELKGRNGDPTQQET